MRNFCVIAAAAISALGTSHPAKATNIATIVGAELTTSLSTNLLGTAEETSTAGALTGSADFLRHVGPSTPGASSTFGRASIGYNLAPSNEVDNGSVSLSYRGYRRTFASGETVTSTGFSLSGYVDIEVARPARLTVYFREWEASRFWWNDMELLPEYPPFSDDAPPLAIWIEPGVHRLSGTMSGVGYVDRHSDSVLYTLAIPEPPAIQLLAGLALVGLIRGISAYGRVTDSQLPTAG